MDPLVQAEVLLAAGEYCFDLYKEEQAVMYLNDALKVFQDFGDKRNIAWCYSILSITDTEPTPLSLSGSTLAQKSLEIFHGLGDKGGMSFALNILGELARVNGDYSAAEGYYKKSLHLAKETGEQLRQGIQHANMGLLAYQTKDYQQAKKLTKQSLRIFLDMDAYYGIIHDIGGLAGAELGLGNPERSACLLGASYAGLDTLESIYQQADQSVINDIIAETKSQMQEDSYLEAWNKGQRMTVQEAFEYALAGDD